MLFSRVPQVSMENFKRLNLAMCPPPTSSMRSLCEEGYSDAVRFLKKEKWMSWRSDSHMERSDRQKHEAPFLWLFLTYFRLRISVCMQRFERETSDSLILQICVSLFFKILKTPFCSEPGPPSEFMKEHMEELGGGASLWASVCSLTFYGLVLFCQRESSWSQRAALMGTRTFNQLSEETFHFPAWSNKKKNIGHGSTSQKVHAAVMNVGVPSGLLGKSFVFEVPDFSAGFLCCRATVWCPAASDVSRSNWSCCSLRTDHHQHLLRGREASLREEAERWCHCLNTASKLKHTREGLISCWFYLHLRNILILQAK